MTSPQALNYPRVTQILSATKPPSEKQKLLEWQRKNMVRGEKARNNGTNFHSAIQHYFTSGNSPQFESKTETNRWQLALPELEIIKNDCLCLETEVWSDKYEYAGRLDCLLWDNQDLILVDWKTSSWFKKKEYIEDYFLQGTAYSLAAYECGVAPKMPSEIRIYLFCPRQIQVFKRILEFNLVIKWLERLNQYKKMNDEIQNFS